MEKFIIENLLVYPKLTDIICLMGLYFLHQKFSFIHSQLEGLTNTVTYIRGKCENQNCTKIINTKNTLINKHITF